MPQAENLSRAASSELARMASYTLSTPVPATPSATADMPGTLMSLVGAEQVMALQSATSEQLPEQRKAWLEAHLPYLRYALWLSTAYCPNCISTPDMSSPREEETGVKERGWAGGVEDTILSSRFHKIGKACKSCIDVDRKPTSEAGQPAVVELKSFQTDFIHSLVCITTSIAQA